MFPPSLGGAKKGSVVDFLPKARLEVEIYDYLASSSSQKA